MLENLAVSNFRSHEKTEIGLHSGLNVFLGEVGAGKTSILEALSFSLFGKISTNLTQTELIRRGSKHAKVILVFTVGSEKYKIERRIFLKKPQKAKLWLYKNNNWKLAVEGSNAVSKSIEEILGVDASTFLAAIYASQGEIKKMLQTQPGKRREQFDKLLGIDVYEKIWDTMGQSKGLVLRELLEVQKKASGFEILTEQEKDIQEEIKEKNLELDLLKTTFKGINKDISPKKRQLNIFEELKIKLESIQTKREESLKNIKKSKERIESLNKQILKTKKAEMVYKTNLKYLEKEEEIRKEKDRIEKAIQKKYSTKRLLESEKNFFEEKNQKSAELKKQLKKLPILQEELKNLGKIKIKYSDFKSEKKDKLIEFNDANIEYIKNCQKNEAETEKIERVSELGECPTCLQEVPEDHKIHIKDATIQKQNDLKNKIKKWEKTKLRIQNEIDLIDSQIENSEEAVKKFERILVKIEVLEKNQKELEKINKDITTIQDRIYSLNWELSGIVETDEHLKKIEVEFYEVSEKAKLAREAQLELASKQNLEKIVLSEEDNLKKLKKENTIFQNSYDEISQKYNSENHNEYRNDFEKLKEKEARTSEGINRLIIALKKEKSKLEETKNNIIEKRDAKEKTKILESELKVLDILRKGLRDILQPAVRKNSVMMVSEEFQQFYQALSNDNIDYAAIDEDGNIEVIRNGEPSPINTLSGGETTCAALALRLSICSSLTKNQLLLLDEPTIHLDEVYRAKLRDFLRTHDFDQLIVVTHDNTFDSLPAQIFNVEKSKGNSTIIALRKGD